MDFCVSGLLECLQEKTHLIRATALVGDDPSMQTKAADIVEQDSVRSDPGEWLIQRAQRGRIPCRSLYIGVIQVRDPLA